MTQVQLRGKNRHYAKYKLGDAYKQYKKENPKGSDFYIDKKIYMEVNRLHIDKVIDSIIDESKEYKIPFTMGGLSIIKRKTNYNKLKYDFGVYRKTGEKVYHLNEHSYGYHFAFRWRKHNAIIKNRSFYSFVPSRYISRRLAKSIKGGVVDYFEIREK